MCSRLALVAILLLNSVSASHAQQPTQKGRVQVRQYFATEVKQIAEDCLADIQSKADWEKVRPERHRQFLDMMGLWPLPKKTDLKATVTGIVDAEKFTIEKVHFQSSPGLYVTGNLYVPKNLKKPAPAILYVCGHARTQIDGVNYGHHVNYQHHPRWFAEHGYVCLIIDTLQLGEIPGVHHGTWPNYKMWWWHNRGYTPAGIECWNGIRAIDYLQSRKEVDGERIGVTGRSGGGAASWWIAAADERVACIIPVAGITSLRSHLIAAPTERFKEGVISGHCDCMYMTNTHRWDFPMVAALCAPRPLMLGNSDKDTIFPVPGYRHIVEKVKKLYKLYDAEEKFTVLETEGPHKDTPELRLGAYAWMNRWLKDDGKVMGKVNEPERPRFSPQELKVLKAIPEDSINAKIQESFIPIADPKLPKGNQQIANWWAKQQSKWKKQVAEMVFGGQTTKPVDLGVKKTHDVTRSGLRLQAFDFQADHSTELTLWLLTADKAEKKTPLVVLNVLDELGWQEVQNELGGTFAKEFGLDKAPEVNKKAVESTQRVLAKFGWAYAYVVPRGMGPTRWAEPDTLEDHHYKRRFALIGQTLDGQRVWDVRRALAVLRGLPNLNKTPLWLQGKRQMAGVALYAAMFEPDVARLDLWEVPTTHKEGPFLLNIRKIFDLPQAVAMVFPCRVYIYVRKQQQSDSWDWPLQVQSALGKTHLKLRVVPQ